MAFWKHSLAGKGYVPLNIIRVMNIIALTAVVAASLVMLVKTFMVSQFYFFDGVSHVITAAVSVFLIISETPLFRSYFSRNWPLLSMTSGFLTLGFLMIVVGVSILGNLNKTATSQSVLGLSFWQIVISSGILTSIMGFANIVANYLFRDKHLGVTARMVRAYGAVAPQKVDDILRSPSNNRRRSFHLGRPDSLPSYHTSPKFETPQVAQVQRAHSAASRPSSGLYSPGPAIPVRSNTTQGWRPVSSVYSQGTTRPPTRMTGLNISGPVNVDQEQFAKFKGSDDIQRPDLAAHPALHADRFI
ncbi:hypothetical protein MMC13_001723 [Lambiella insularis]|nr:hypothetical protein [Lambiella insularis]